MPKCRVIARLGAGTDKIDVAAATAAGIVVTNVPDFCMNEQAEHTLALLLAFARRLPYMTRAMHNGDWTARSHPGVHRIAGQTLGLVGFGASCPGGGGAGQAVRTEAAGLDPEPGEVPRRQRTARRRAAGPRRLARRKRLRVDPSAAQPGNALICSTSGGWG